MPGASPKRIEVLKFLVDRSLKVGFDDLVGSIYETTSIGFDDEACLGCLRHRFHGAYKCPVALEEDVPRQLVGGPVCHSGSFGADGRFFCPAGGLDRTNTRLTSSH